jgi:hypothetical protein
LLNGFLRTLPKDQLTKAKKKLEELGLKVERSTFKGDDVELKVVLQ